LQKVKFIDKVTPNTEDEKSSHACCGVRFTFTCILFLLLSIHFCTLYKKI